MSALDAALGGPLSPPTCAACSAPMQEWPIPGDSLLWQCRSCWHVERDLRLAPAGARSLEYGGDPSADRLRLAITERRLRRRAGRATTGRILEIGAGGGALSERLARDARAVTAVDVHPGPEPSSANLRRLTGRVEDLALPAGSFDLILGIHVLEHVDDVGALLAQVRGLLAPGGIGYFVTPNARCRALEAFGADWWMLEDPTHVRFLSATSAELLARRAGFRATRVRLLLADSLAADGATLARRLQRGPEPAGVLSRPAGRALALATLPLSLPLRVVRPEWRPALEMMVR